MCTLVSLASWRAPQYYSILFSWKKTRHPKAVYTNPFLSARVVDERRFQFEDRAIDRAMCYRAAHENTAYLTTAKYTSHPVTRRLEVNAALRQRRLHSYAETSVVALRRVRTHHRYCIQRTSIRRLWHDMTTIVET